MTKSKNNLFIVLIFSLILPHTSFASLPDSEEKGPQIIQHTVSGAGEFAEQIEKYLQNSSSQNTLIITDVHGIVTNHSNPDDQPYDWDNKKTIYQSRGNMVSYFKFLIDREFLVLFSSAWPKPKATSDCLASLGLLDRQEKVHEETYVVKNIRKYPPVTEEDLQDVANDPTMLKILQNRPLEEIIQTPYVFFQQGNSISVASDFKFFRSKALAPNVFFRKDTNSPQFETLIFIEDSQTNINIFKNQLPLTQSYSTLKKVIIFQFPEIKGETRDEDNIRSELLTLPVKE